MRNILLVLLLVPFASVAAEEDFVLKIKDHQFQPAEVKVPAGKKIRLLVENQDASAEEFESHSLNREKVIAGHGQASIYIGPLAPGRYGFIGEFHADSAQGVVIAE